jgi:hypothetical protein
MKNKIISSAVVNTIGTKSVDVGIIKKQDFTIGRKSHGFWKDSAP